MMITEIICGNVWNKVLHILNCLPHLLCQGKQYGLVHGGHFCNDSHDILSLIVLVHYLAL